ncbi:MAG: hypothetical protein LBL55_06745 [Propionibacteriaceae bacterium]|jgi:hypothetical protein|nr:hypothetical protein [Propionibacteriaceae bacterium]
MNWLKSFILMALILALGACAGGPDEDGPAVPTVTPGARLADNLVTLFQRVLERDDLSDFERDVFTRAAATGRIDPADYEEAHLRESRCMKDAGYELTYTKRNNGLYLLDSVIGLPSVEAFDEQSSICSDGILAHVEAYFSLQQNNPDLLADNREVVVRCLVKAGLVPSSYGVEDFQRDFVEWDDDSDIIPFDPLDLITNDCLLSGGYDYRGMVY